MAYNHEEAEKLLQEARGLLAGNLNVTVTEDAEVGIVGRVSMSRGVIDLFSRRYQVDKAFVLFDGSTDPSSGQISTRRRKLMSG